MKTKIFAIITLAFFVAGVSFGQGERNAPIGSSNQYQGQYGTPGSSRGAMDAVVYVDYSIGPDFVVAGLTNLGYTVTIASGWGDFDSKLLSGNYGLAVSFNQDQPGTGPSPAAMQSFMAAGGCIIYCDWSKDNSRVSVLEASFTGGNNLTTMTVSDAGIAAGIANPVIMSNTGWVWTFSTGLAATGSGQVLATFENGDAAIVRGNGGKSIVLGYLGDAPLLADRQQLFENVVNSTLCGAGTVPVSDWAIYLGIFLMLSFVVFRFAKAS